MGHGPAACSRCGGWGWQALATGYCWVKPGNRFFPFPRSLAAIAPGKGWWHSWVQEHLSLPAPCPDPPLLGSSTLSQFGDRNCRGQATVRREASSCVRPEAHGLLDPPATDEAQGNPSGDFAVRRGQGILSTVRSSTGQMSCNSAAAPEKPGRTLLRCAARHVREQRSLRLALRTPLHACRRPGRSACQRRINRMRNNLAPSPLTVNPVITDSSTLWLSPEEWVVHLHVRQKVLFRASTAGRAPLRATRAPGQV